MTFSISRSSTPASSAAPIAPLAAFSRASLSAAGRSNDPTWSARNGGLVRAVMGLSLRILLGTNLAPCWLYTRSKILEAVGRGPCPANACSAEGDPLAGHDQPVQTEHALSRVPTP